MVKPNKKNSLLEKLISVVVCASGIAILFWRYIPDLERRGIGYSFIVFVLIVIQLIFIITTFKILKDKLDFFDAFGMKRTKFEQKNQIKIKIRRINC